MTGRTWLSLGCASRAGCVAVLFAGTGCAAPGHLWHKPGVTDAQRDQDYQHCVNATHDSPEAGEAADIEASENGQSHMPNVLPETSFNRGSAAASGNGLAECMFSQGYRYY